MYYNKCMSTQLSDHFTYPRLIRFSLSPVFTLIFISIYSVIDGWFVSNLVSKDAFTALNLIYPFVSLLAAVAFMFGSGGSAIVAKTLGEGQQKKACGYFSMITLSLLATGLALTIAGLLCLPIIVKHLAHSRAVYDLCMVYGEINLVGLIFLMFQLYFQPMLIAAERPRMCLAITILCGLTNIVLDYISIAVWHWGIAGAGFASIFAEAIGTLIPVVYFLTTKKTILRFEKPLFERRTLRKTCFNGSSELVTNLSVSLVSILYNIQMLRLAGDNGVDAYGTVMYVDFIFAAILFGYCQSVAPLISYHYGAQNHKEMQNLFTKSLVIVVSVSIGLLMACNLFARQLSSVFVGYDQNLMELTVHGLHIYAVHFLFFGINVFASAFFTALNNGKISAFLSMVRTFFLQVAAVMVLPYFLQVDGVWSSVLFSEGLSLFLSVYFLWKYRHVYHYVV